MLQSSNFVHIVDFLKFIHFSASNFCDCFVTVTVISINSVHVMNIIQNTQLRVPWAASGNFPRKFSATFNNVAMKNGHNTTLLRLCSPDL